MVIPTKDKEVVYEGRSVSISLIKVPSVSSENAEDYEALEEVLLDSMVVTVGSIGDGDGLRKVSSLGLFNVGSI